MEGREVVGRGGMGVRKGEMLLKRGNTLNN